MTKTKNTGATADAQDVQQFVHHTDALVDASNQSLQVTAHLQSALELNKVLELFHDDLALLVSHDGLAYTNEEDDYSIDFGEAALHRCRYRLTLLGQYIGELALSRQEKFTDEEIQQIKALVGALIHPLNNALLYRRAVEKVNRDTVTGVGSRAAMDHVLKQEIDLAVRHGTILSVMMLDIDKFKLVNDTYGHIAGDAVLKHVADILIERMRRSDIIFRYGGEEFVILLRNTHTPGAKLLAERIRQSVESMYFKHGDFDIRVTISAGLSSVQSDDTPTSLLDRCDQALYEAKQSGRNCIVTTAP